MKKHNYTAVAARLDTLQARFGTTQFSLARVSSKTFDEPVLKTVGRKAAAGERVQDLMRAVDLAIQDDGPIKDWSVFAYPSPEFSGQAEPAKEWTV